MLVFKCSCISLGVVLKLIHLLQAGPRAGIQICSCLCFWRERSTPNCEAMRHVLLNIHVYSSALKKTHRRSFKEVHIHN